MYTFFCLVEKKSRRVDRDESPSSGHYKAVRSAVSAHMSSRLGSRSSKSTALRSRTERSSRSSGSSRSEVSKMRSDRIDEERQRRRQEQSKSRQSPRQKAVVEDLTIKRTVEVLSKTKREEKDRRLKKQANDSESETEVDEVKTVRIDNGEDNKEEDEGKCIEEAIFPDLCHVMYFSTKMHFACSAYFIELNMESKLKFLAFVHAGAFNFRLCRA